jgi:signal peptidase I
VKRRRGWSWLQYPAIVLGLLGMAGVIAMAILSRAYNVPAASMMPNLEVGDHMFAWRGYYAQHAPARGEIALFRHRDTVFVKRVIGLPGDTIQMKAGRLWINGVEVERHEDGSELGQDGATFKRYQETLPNGVSYPILELGDDGMFDQTDPFTVPADSYFVMGDNRDNSNDSRVPDFGTVPREKFTDRPFLIYFSKTFSRIGSRIN